MLLRLIVVSSLVVLSSSLTCYDCYSTGPDRQECTKERSCKGYACMMFDAGDNRTATAFCLLAMHEGEDLSVKKDGCWLEPDGKSKHCMCHTDFCNKLTEPGEHSADPLAPLLPDAEFLKQNPLIDYENPLEDSAEDGAAPPPRHVLFPSAVQSDPKVDGDDEEDDLVPVDFEEYDNNVGNDKQTNTKVDTKSTSSHPPSCVLMFLTMATSWARLLVQL